MPEYSDGTFQWDEAKSDATFRLRGFDFAYASRIFDWHVVEGYDACHSSDEDRFVYVGVVDNRFLAVVATYRGTERRIISARLATRPEQDQWIMRYGSIEERSD
jgi:uncharacterized DUF497 family protein